MRLSSLSVVVVLALLAGCQKADDGSNGSVGVYSLFDPVAANPSLCGGPAIPFPNNALFADGASPTGVAADATLNIPSTASTAVAANLTDGFSTTASIFTDVLGAVDYSSTGKGLIVLEITSAGPRILQAGVDYTVQPSVAMSTVSGTGGCAQDATVNTLPAKFMPIAQQRSRILIEPLKPLKPSTNYIVAMTKDLKSKDGVAATPNEFFPIVNRSTRICKLPSDSSGSEIACTDPAAPATLAQTIAPVLGTLAPAATCTVGCTSAAVKLITLETLRRNLVRPTVQAFETYANTLLTDPVTDEDLVIAWSFTTESTNATLATLNATATAKTFSLVHVPGGAACTTPGVPGTPALCDVDGNGFLGTGEAIPGAANSSDIWVGTINAVPYYLHAAASIHDAASQLDYWHSANVVTSVANGGFVPWTPVADYGLGLGNTPAPCNGAPFHFEATKPDSTTNCFRIPAATTTLNLPIIVTVPHAAKPGSGWPVVIFQHGITGNRGQMLPFGATMGSGNMITVAIDLPLHGIVAGDPQFGAFRQAGNERTFDLDVSNGSSCLSNPGGDGTTDPSGTCFINLGSLATSRDNLRQAVSDLINLTKSVSSLDVDGSAGADVDSAKIYYTGMSLGGIVGGTLLGVNTDIKAAVLNVPGGGVAKLLDASYSFGPIVAAGLSGVAIATNLSGASSPFEGTDTYETFIRFAQHLVDPGDPINYAVAAATAHPILMQEVIGDTVVPNTALTTCPAAAALPFGIGATATDNTTANTRLAACKAGAELVGSNSVTTAACYAGVAKVGVCAGTASQDATMISGYLSGTEPLYTNMGLDVIGPITPGTDCANQTDAGGLRQVVQFATGAHSSLLSPTASLATTQEMQREALFFLGSGGLTVAGGGC